MNGIPWYTDVMGSLFTHDGRVRPVIRYVGSKYRKIQELLDIFDLDENSTFIDLFAGSGIVSVNVKNLVGCKVVTNDYDHIFPLSWDFVSKNQRTYEGLGKIETTMAIANFERRCRLGLSGKVTEYNQILESCEILHKDYRDVEITPGSVVYVDPPYYGIKGLYQHTIDHKELREYLQKYVGGGHIIVSYNDCLFIRELYKDWHIKTLEFKYSSGGYGSAVKTKKELLISNWKWK